MEVIGIVIILELAGLGYLYWKWTTKTEPVLFEKDYELIDYEVCMTEIEPFKTGMHPLVEKPSTGVGWRMMDCRLLRGNNEMKLAIIWRRELEYAEVS